jgi:hypothetical protein
MYIVLFSNRIAYKVALSYTPYQLVYGLHPLMPTEYVMPTIDGDHKMQDPLKC